MGRGRGGGGGSRRTGDEGRYNAPSSSFQTISQPIEQGKNGDYFTPIDVEESFCGGEIDKISDRQDEDEIQISKLEKESSNNCSVELTETEEFII